MNGGFETVIKMMGNPEISLDATFQMITNCSAIIPFIPRMDIFRYLP